MTTLALSPSQRRAFERLAADCRRVFGDRLEAVVAASTTSGVIFASSFASSDLEALGALVETWHHDGLDTPLLLTSHEFRRSLDTFPIQYMAVIERHAAIWGTAPFADATIRASHLRQACEVQAKGHLIHLRQGWLQAGAHAEHVARLVASSAAPLRTLLTNVARLQNADDHQRPDGALAGAKLAGLREDLVRDVLALEDHPERSHAVVKRLPEYLAASEQLWLFVDGWRSDT